MSVPLGIAIPILLASCAGTTLNDITPRVVAKIKAVWNSYNNGSLREFYLPGPAMVTLIYGVTIRPLLPQRPQESFCNPPSTLLRRCGCGPVKLDGSSFPSPLFATLTEVEGEDRATN